ncbi:hypothetical protein KBY55_16575 [Streptomyces sp. b94]|uniref:hypothetical protein n=1 Tax=Streptomyces sp. b94 TaxID=1827634 RepID=UPI001B366B1E|nr:hypothetical protein [Streptomyces sp. b94]MBQ1097661.1 hypothetical protein [Streptomyces sp. b94]
MGHAGTDAADRLTGPGRVALLTGGFPPPQNSIGRGVTRLAVHGFAAQEIHAELGSLAGRRGDAPGAVAVHRQGPLPEAERGDVERITAGALAVWGARTLAAECSTDAGDDPDRDHGGPTAGDG